MLTQFYFQVYNYFDNLLHREEGQDLAEYAILLGLIALVVIAAVIALRTPITTIFNNVAAQLGAAAAGRQLTSDRGPTGPPRPKCCRFSNAQGRFCRGQLRPCPRYCSVTCEVGVDYRHCPGHACWLAALTECSSHLILHARWYFGDRLAAPKRRPERSR